VADNPKQTTRRGAQAAASARAEEPETTTVSPEDLPPEPSVPSVAAGDDVEPPRTKLPVEYLLNRSDQLLGYPRHVLVGALELSGGATEMTVEAARKLILDQQSKSYNPEEA
jgi:hypothetical protein